MTRDNPREIGLSIGYQWAAGRFENAKAPEPADLDLVLDGEIPPDLRGAIDAETVDHRLSDEARRVDFWQGFVDGARAASRGEDAPPGMIHRRIPEMFYRCAEAMADGRDPEEVMTEMRATDGERVELAEFAAGVFGRMRHDKQ